MPDDSIQVALTPADAGETGYRMINAAVTATEGSLAEARVRFRIADGSGGLGAGKTREAEVETDEWGIAQINWHADAVPRSEPRAQEEQVATIRADCDDDRARSVRLHVAQTHWLPRR